MGLPRAVKKRAKARNIDNQSNAFIGYDDAAIIIPVEVADRKWAEFEAKNPDMAKMERYRD